MPLNLRPLWCRPLKGRTTAFLMMLVVALQNVNSQPQGPGAFENVAGQSVAAASNVAEMMGNAAVISKTMDFEMPFVQAKSESKAGTGAALRNNDDDSDYDSDSDSDSEENRRKRSLEISENTLMMGEEYLLPLPLPLNRQPHFHRDKRAPCHTYGGGAGGGGVPADGDDIESVRRAYARKRKAAAKKAKGKKASTGSRKKKLISDDDDSHQVLLRRKRQSEVDDLNNNMENASNDFVQYVRQVGEKIRRTYEQFVASVTDMAQKLKQQFSGQNATDAMEN